ncbi:hypothetical protein PILCRDRAFT_817612 [Piloderma croceum F 1598]|uniref:Uncharacterized protein n=1 Tax=Piloderma croceum (strain F 1598) TaxID=765440 RepID=A0A0C3G2G7_PILCF|nr:hypothetical protein PILCRDRAFT_817612 [Piloderma croceum F 1598]
MGKSHHFLMDYDTASMTHTTSCRALSSTFCLVNKSNDIDSPLHGVRIYHRWELYRITITGYLQHAIYYVMRIGGKALLR